MPSITGLATGLDTSSIVEGLLSIQQSRIDRLNVQKQGIAAEQTAFRSMEANLISLQSKLGTLLRSTNSVFESRTATSSDDEAIQVTATSEAAEGIYRFQVNQLATSHQIATSGFASATDEIATGTMQIRVGTSNATAITIDAENNNVQGLADAINSQTSDITATILDDGSGSGTDVRILLTSDKTGAANEISITGDVALTSLFDFAQPVQAGQNAIVQIGSGGGAILLQSQTNQLDDAIPGLSLDLLQADPAKTIEIRVSQDTQAAKEAVTDFVDAYNDVVDFVNQRNSFDTETQAAGIFLGSGTANSALSELRSAVLSPVAGIDGRQAPNVLSAIGITTDSNGKLTVNSSKLDAALAGENGVTMRDLQKLFGLQGESTNPGIEFVLGTHRTQPSTASTSSPTVSYEVDLTVAPERAVFTGASSLAGAIVFDENNDQLQLRVDGIDLSINFPHGTYDATELPSLLTDLVNSHNDIQGREISARLNDNSELEITSVSFGAQSRIEVLDLPETSTRGAAATLLGVDAVAEATGKDVGGVFRYEDPNSPGTTVTETATGSGRILTGDRFTRGISADGMPEQRTADLRVRVELTSSQLGDGAESSLTITQGIASRLDTAIRGLLETGSGEFSTIDDRFDRQIASIDASLERLNDQFTAREQSLLDEFSAMEAAVAELQSVGNTITSALLRI